MEDSLRQPKAPRQIRKAWIGTQAIQLWITINPRHIKRPISIRSIQPRECLISISQTRVNDGDTDPEVQRSLS
jgi:hypothetical protein